MTLVPFQRRTERIDDVQYRRRIAPFVEFFNIACETVDDEDATRWLAVHLHELELLLEERLRTPLDQRRRIIE